VDWLLKIFNVRIHNILVRNGVKTKEDLLNLDLDKLAKQPQVGKIAIEKIKKYIDDAKSSEEHIE
jgi:DNA-directed RNA polymerase alpha subunit